MFDRHFKVWPKGVPHEIDFPRRNLSENLRLTAERVPEKTAVVYHGARITFAELFAKVAAMAGWLQNNGVRKGDRVLLYMQNSPQYVIAYYAILRANAVVVPVNPMNRVKELSHLIADTGARVAFAGQELLDHIAPALADGRLGRIVVAAYADMSDPDFDIPLPQGLRDPAPESYGIAGVTRFADALAAGYEPGPILAGPDDLAVIPYTSGTTGNQKGCMHTHFTVMVTCVGGAEWNPVGLGDVSLTVLPMFHVTGMTNSMNIPVYCGETIVIMTRWDRAVAAELIRRYRIARWRSISTMAIDLVNDPDLDSYDLSSLKAIGGGGSSMPEPVARRLREITGLDYVEGYGMSETMAATHINPVHRPHRQCLGVPVFGVDSRVVDPVTLEELAPNEPGEIVIHGPQVFLGYWNDPDATRAAMIEIDGKRFIRTGDIGRYDEDGYFYIVDRVKRMVNVSGFKVWPTEVEAMIHDHPDIAEVCIVGYPDPRRGEGVMAYVVPRGPIGEDALIGWCREQMAAYKCPSRVRFVETLPRSPSGKVQWLQLQKQAESEAGLTA
ncbi:AMP-binding protein [Stappia sp. GBMRC 2046]|uniref:AMP-binding protein n=1 Tax=Stappia sediminis TaxID=2692190 RepID=A0A7X3LWI9_9HYPH|nr:long-chain-fatty-acid--CoA ligase [Stappia sediminis]MXN66353.1 AMP-binding protein [Stappia sediminis]